MAHVVSDYVWLCPLLDEEQKLTTIPCSGRYPTYPGHNVHVVMCTCLGFATEVQLITMSYWPRYFTYLGHNVRVVMRGCMWFYCQNIANNDDLFGAIFYMSGPQCTRCYARIYVVLLSEYR